MQERIEEFEKNIQTKANEIDIEKHRNDFESQMDVDVDFEDFDSLMLLSKEQVTALKNKAGTIASIENEYNEIVKKELDVVFDAKISSVAFRYCQPFDAVIVEDKNGNEKTEMYIVHFLHWLSIELRKYAERNSVAMNKHIEKYVK